MNGSYDVWSAGIARKTLAPHTRTGNPTPAAAHLLGKRRVRTAERRLKRGGRKRYHRGNPIPAVGAVLSAGLGGAFSGAGHVKARRQKEAQRLLQLALAGDKDAATSIKLHASLGWAGFPEALAVLTGMRPAAPAAAAPSSGLQLNQLLSSPVGVAVARSAATSAFRRPRRQRYPSYIDRYGRQRYSYKTPGAQMRLPTGAQASPGSPYNFFTGRVGGGSALQTAGQVAVAGAAGVGAYLVTQRLLQYLGGRAQSKEEAGVNAAKALHQALEDYKAAHGSYPPPAERAAMKAAYQQQLEQLGYDPVTFTRTRSGVEDFLETYNPFGG